MGTNDGSRNFSANCDLKRSMNSDRQALASARETQRAVRQTAPATTGRGSWHAGRPTVQSLSFGTFSAFTHTRKKGRKGETLPHCPALRV